MTTPSGLSGYALAFFGAARGAVAQRVNTAGFYQALRDAGATIGTSQGGLSFSDVNALRSSAAGIRNAQEAFGRAPSEYAIDASMIGRVPYGRPLAEQNAQPMFTVGINLHTADSEGEITSDYRAIRFTGQLPATKADLEALIAQDAEALADTYNAQYAGHDILEILAR